MNNELEKLVNTIKTIGAIENIDYSYQSEKQQDDYCLNIKIVRKHSNNDAMLIIEEDIAMLRLKIRINSNALFEAYKLLNEEEKIPKHLNIINPCIEDNCINNLVEVSYLEIINNLKAFNGLSDNYDAIARLVGKYYGNHIGKENYGI
jgi:NDP-sugar pyrophosphorylase family protein